MKTVIDKLKNNSSLLKILFAILFITLPFVGFYLGMGYEKTLTSEPTSFVGTEIQYPTTNWKTYDNVYSFQYPSNWTVREDPSNLNVVGIPSYISLILPYVYDSMTESQVQ